jgi:hypothetical protein
MKTSKHLPCSCPETVEHQGLLHIPPDESSFLVYLRDTHAGEIQAVGYYNTHKMGVSHHSIPRRLLTGE